MAGGAASGARPGAAIVGALAGAIAPHEDVAFAYLFGSAATGRLTAESDVDVALYFVPTAGLLELEAETTYPAEREIWAACERAAGREVDLVVLNRTAALLTAAVFDQGIPILIREPLWHSRFFCAATTLAEEERAFARDFLAIKARSRSLTPIDRDRRLRGATQRARPRVSRSALFANQIVPRRRDGALSSTRGDHNGELVSTYRYDGRGLRIVSERPGADARYTIYGRAREIMYEESGSEGREFVYLGRDHVAGRRGTVYAAPRLARPQFRRYSRRHGRARRWNYQAHLRRLPPLPR